MSRSLYAVGFALLAACSTPRMLQPGVVMTPSAANPAATGTVKVQKDDAHNSVVQVEVEHLAPPERLSEKAKVYVVWIEPLGAKGDTQNAGVLYVDSDQEGSIEVTTPLQQFEVYITPEADPTVSNPTESPVLSTSVR